MKAPIGRSKAIILGIAVIVLGFMTYQGYAKKLSDLATLSTLDMLTETVAHQRAYIAQGLLSDVRALQDMSFLLGRDAALDGVEIATLAGLLQRTHFDALSLFDLQGQATVVGGPPVAPPDFAPPPDRREDGAANYALDLRGDGELLVALPVQDANGRCIGYLVGTHPLDTLRQSLLPFSNGLGTTFLISQRDGLIVSTYGPDHSTHPDPGGASFWSWLGSTTHLGYDTVPQAQENVSAGASGYMVFRSDGQKRLARYEPMGISDWYLFSMVDDSSVSGQVDLIFQSAVGLSLIAIAVSSVLLLYILRQQRKHGAEMERVAYYDELCGCPNLQRFRHCAQQFIDEHRDELLMMVKLDIDRFKLVNQALGEEMGDRVLLCLAQALRDDVQQDERRFARAHDDEFYVLHSYREQADLTAARQFFLTRFAQLMGEDLPYHIRFISGAYYMSLEDCTSAVEAIEKANIAHRKAKATGRELCVYDESFIKEALRRKELEERMEAALRGQEFQVYLQPQFGLRSDTVIGAEALVRWKGRHGETIYPNEFIPMFEENGFIVRLDMYMFEQSCRCVRSWLDSGLTPVPISVNFARNHLANPDFVRELCTIADRYELPRALLEIELTERAISQDQEISLQVLELLHENGFSLSMDDFGTGYSSLGLLKNIPVDILKIDKSFFERADDQPRTKAVLLTILRLAKDLDAFTIAEGVETQEVAELLRESGCDAIQGYYFQRPLCERAFKKMLVTRQERGGRGPLSTRYDDQHVP